MSEPLESFDRRIAKILRDRLKLPSPMSQNTRETFHDYIRYMSDRTVDDIRENITPLLSRVDTFTHDHTLTTDEWTLLCRLRYDRDYESHARLRGCTRLSEFVHEINGLYRSGMLARARGAVPKIWRDRLRTIAN